MAKLFSEYEHYGTKTFKIENITNDESNIIPMIANAGVDDVGSFNDFLHSGSAEASDMFLVAINRDIRVEDRVAVYQQVLSGTDELQKYLGELYQHADDCSWYYPVDISTRKYLIQHSNSTTSLWKFISFVVDDGEDSIDISYYESRFPLCDFSAYTYADVYRMIYDVNNAEDIVSIVTLPSRENNTLHGIAIQQEVGSHTYSSREDIEAFYTITNAVLCLGANNWSSYYDIEYRLTYGFSTDEPDKLTSGEGTYGSRWLVITLTDGTTIESWIYDALRGCFIEFGGIATVALPEKSVNTLNQIFGIS